MKVKAKCDVYYRLRRQREGDVFELKDPKHFSEKSMEKLEGKKEQKPAAKPAAKPAKSVL